ncbi:hypothetical protein J6590_026732 [Homalodisca vitripennis]|nr:hypothetical protein J6590_026732 [Homalodisca vitripennis]
MQNCIALTQLWRINGYRILWFESTQFFQREQRRRGVELWSACGHILEWTGYFLEVISAARLCSS